MGLGTALGLGLRLALHRAAGTVVPQPGQRVSMAVAASISKLWPQALQLIAITGHRR